jgi:hypothetical protein
LCEEKEMSVKVGNLGELKSFVETNKGGFSAPAEGKGFNYSPMFLPIETAGNVPIQIQTRGAFLKKGVDMWKQMNLGLVLAIAGAVLALALLPVNAFLAAFAGGASGYFYGLHFRQKLYYYEIYKKRPVLEST